MSHHDSNTYFEDRLAQIEPGLIRRVKYRMSRASEMDREDAVQAVRILLWERFSAEPEKWAALPVATVPCPQCGQPMQWVKRLRPSARCPP